MSNKKEIVLYALSTCVWCRKAKRLLDQTGISYTTCDVDLLSGQERKEAIATVTRLAGKETYPVIVINNNRVICGYDEQEILEAVS